MKWYGYLGIFLIAFAIVNFYFVLQPFALLYIPIIWFGYIFLLDAIVFKLKKRSFIASYPKEFLLMLIVSVPFWEYPNSTISISLRGYTATMSGTCT